MATVAGDMVGNEHPIPPLILFDAFARLHHLTGDLMSKYQRRLADAVPLHHIGSADSTGLDTD